jgi:hypothetical protein
MSGLSIDIKLTAAGPGRAHESPTPAVASH